jgi:hypothetical protein
LSDDLLNTSIKTYDHYGDFRQPVTINGTLAAGSNGRVKLIENYLYLYHTDTLVVLPTYPETIADSMAVNFSPTTPLSRSAPIYSYINSGPRSFQISLPLHRELLWDVNRESASINPDGQLASDDYINTVIKQIQSAALPKYSAGEKQLNPPIVAVKFGSDIFCKGVITGAVTATYSGPVLRNDRYSMVTLDFTISETDPYDAVSVANLGSFRGENEWMRNRLTGKG